MFNGLTTCQSTFLHQSSRQPPPGINATLAQHLADGPATGSATTEHMESSHPASQFNPLHINRNRTLHLCVINATVNTP
ncbi:hypothetical protein B9T65_00015 [Serratia marcescens]|nr:hypothetical protein B9T65_00015 [Serratia marcescens]